MISRSLAAALLVLTTGCHATHLVYVHNASLGLDVAVSTEGTQRLVFGYDRDTYALVPVKTVPSETTPGGATGQAKKYDAMSLTAVSHVRADGLAEVRFDHFVSTGEAAKKLALDSDGIESIRTAIFGPRDTAATGANP
ncbi:MAG: hypothetical protein QNK04_17970 [Myxococcota bacterium]|nr:hypothetical protein [Myxococcota bacterium]